MKTLKNKVYLGLGSNLGRRSIHLEEAIREILKIGKITQRSSIYESDPMGYPSGHQFLNMVILLETELDPISLLEHTQRVEVEHLRRSSSDNYQDRTLDIDTLFYNDLILVEPTIQIPHPALHERAFVIVPLMEIDPEFIHPIMNKTIAELYINCMGIKDIKPYHP